MNKAFELTNGNAQVIAHINLIKGRIAAKKNDWPQAMSFYEQAAKTIESIWIGI